MRTPRVSNNFLPKGRYKRGKENQRRGWNKNWGERERQEKSDNKVWGQGISFARPNPKQSNNKIGTGNNPPLRNPPQGSLIVGFAQTRTQVSQGTQIPNQPKRFLWGEKATTITFYKYNFPPPHMILMDQYLSHLISTKTK